HRQDAGSCSGRFPPPFRWRRARTPPGARGRASVRRPGVDGPEVGGPGIGAHGVGGRAGGEAGAPPARLLGDAGAAGAGGTGVREWSVTRAGPVRPRTRGVPPRALSAATVGGRCPPRGSAPRPPSVARTGRRGDGGGKRSGGRGGTVAPWSRCIRNLLPADLGLCRPEGRSFTLRHDLVALSTPAS